MPRKSSDPSVVIGLSLPVSIISALNSEAQKRGLSRSALARTILEKELKADEKKRAGRWTILEP